MADVFLDPMTWYEYQIANEYGGDDDQQGFAFRTLFTAVVGSRYVVDFRAYPEDFKRIRSIWIDNSAGTIAATVTTDVMRNISVPAGAQALVTLINSPENKIWITGNGTLNLTATNRDLRPFAIASGAVTATISGNVMVWGALCTVINPGQVTMTAVAAQIVAANGARKALVLSNSGTQIVAIGTAGVTYATGFRMNPGDKLVWDIPVMAASIYGICNTSLTSSIDYLETAP